MADEHRDQVVHAFDAEHQRFADERQKQYPDHIDHPRARYDWAQGVVCGCGVPLAAGLPVEVPKYKHPEAPPFNGGHGRVWQKDIMAQNNPDRVSEREQFNRTNGTNIRTYSEYCDWKREHVKKGDLLATGRNYLTPSHFPTVADTDEEHELAAGARLAEALKKPGQVLLVPNERIFAVEEQPVHEIRIQLPDGLSTETAAYILGGLLPQWAAMWQEKHKDYGEHANDLGAPGQYAELHRKIGKLRRAMWEGEELVSEPAREVAMDMIGHLFLAIMFLDNPDMQKYPKKNEESA